MALELLQSSHRAAVAEVGQPAAAENLRRLHNKLNLPDTPDAQLDVSALVSTCNHLVVNHLLDRLHLTDDIRCGTAPLSAVSRSKDKRLYETQEGLSHSPRAGDRPGLQEGQTFPLLPPRPVVPLVFSQRSGQPTHGALGAKSKIHPEHVTF